MKLHELGKTIPTGRLAETLNNYSGVKLDFDNLDVQKAHSILGQLQSFLKEYRRSPAFFSSEKDPRYLRMMMVEQALSAKLDEYGDAAVGSGAANGGGAAVSKGAVGGITDPKAKMVMDKVKRGQALTPDEQKTFNQIALANENKNNRRMVKESEVQQAQVVLAAQDMVDRVQKMMEDISEMQFKDLPALVNSIRNDMGTDQAQSFGTAATQALSGLLTACQTGKTELESAQSALTGQEPVVPGAGGDEEGMPPANVGGDQEELDLDLDANVDTDDIEDVEADLGRERR